MSYEYVVTPNNKQMKKLMNNFMKKKNQPTQMNE